MTAKLLCGAALVAVLCSPALAQTLSKGMILKIGPDGQVATGTMPTDAKMLRMMHSQSHAMGSGTLTVWMDDKGRMMVCSCGEGRGSQWRALSVAGQLRVWPGGRSGVRRPESGLADRL
jgi:hypothetical protein